jgi:hypothetical protein
MNVNKENDKQTLVGEWSDDLSAFWFGANGCEFVSWKGSHDIYVYPVDDYPNPPAYVIHGIKQIETLEDFNYTLNNGIEYECNYERTNDFNR